MTGAGDQAGRRRRGAIAVGRLVGDIAESAFRRHGLGHGEIARAWTEIAGAELAAVSRPERLSWPRGGSQASDKRPTGATLTVAVDGPRSIELQYAAPQIIEAINTLYGYRAVGRIRLVQASQPIRPKRQPRPDPIKPDHPEEFADIDSPELRTALARLNAATERR